MKKKMRSAASLLLCFLLAAECAACAAQKGKKSNAVTRGNEGYSGEIVTLPTQSVENVDPTVPETPISAESGEVTPESEEITEDGSTKIVLQGNSAAVSGDGADVDGSIVTVTKAGRYLLSGTLTGRIEVNVEDGEKVELCLNGVKIVGDEHAAVYIVKSPKKTVITSVKGSVNILEDAETYVLPEGVDEPNACVFSKDDLAFGGEGELYVTSHGAKGICCKDDLTVDGTLTVLSADDGIKGKDSVTVNGGKITVSAGADGIKSTNAEKEGKGTVLIRGGVVLINAGDDGIDAASDVLLERGSVSILTGKGADANPGKKENGPGGGGGGGGGRPPRFEAIAPDTVVLSAETAVGGEVGGKGVKSDTSILLDGAEVRIDSYDDALHASESVSVRDGTLYVKSGDDGIHCDEKVDISGGVSVIAKSFEGIEGRYITVSGGQISITASDDGFNATAGSGQGNEPGGDPRGFVPGGGFGPGGMTGQDCLLRIEGGYTVVNSGGDGLDSNGNIEQSGGRVIVFGPSDNGNGAIDYGDGRENAFTFTGGELLAVGSSGMMQTVTSDLQSIALRMNNLSAKTNVYLLDEKGNCLVAFQTPKSISSIVFASSGLSVKSVSVYTGGTLPASEDGVSFFPGEAPTGGKLLGTVDVK